MIVGFRLVTCAFLISRAAAAEQKPNYYTFCFWDGFSRWRPEPYNSAVGDIPAELCNAVVYSHVTIDDKRSSIRLTDKELQLDPEAKSYSNSRIYNPIWLLPPNRIFAQMRDLKRRNSKLKLLLAVGGPHDPVEKYWQLFPQVYIWKDITASLIQWLRTYDFDGVVLDFFSGTASLHDAARSWDNAKFIHPFVRQINRDLMAAKESWSITFTLPAFDSTTHHLFDIEKLTMEVNFFLVKTSDCLEFPKGSLLNVTRTMDMTDIDRAELVVMKGAPRQRIVLEIPLSGRTYTATAATSGVHTVFPGHSGPYTKLQGFLAFFEVCSHIKSGWTRERFGEEACSFLKLADQYVAYEDNESVSRKARMVMGRQYRGAAIRSVDLGDYNGMCSEKSHLVKAIRSTLDITNYYVHFYYDPPNTTWWKEVEGKHTTTQLPSTSPPRSEPTRPPLPTGSATQGPPKGTPALTNRHTPFVPFVPSAEEQTTATKATSEATTRTWTALSTPNAHSTLTQAAPPTAPPTATTDIGTDPQSATTPSSSPGLLDRLLDQFGRLLQGGAGDVSAAPPTTPSHSTTTKAEASSAWSTTTSPSPGLFDRLLDQFGRFLQGGASDVSPAPPTTQGHSPTTKAEISSESPTTPSASPGLFDRLLDQFGRLLQGGAGKVSAAPSTTSSHTPTTKVETSSAPPPTPSASPGFFDRFLDQFGRFLQGGTGAVSPALPTTVPDFPTTKVEASSTVPVTLSVPVTFKVQTSSAQPMTASVPLAPKVETSSAQPVTASVPLTPKVETSSAQPATTSVPLTPKVETSSAQPATASVPLTPKVETSSAQPVTASVPLTPTVETSSAQPMTASVPSTPKYPISSVKPMVTSLPPTSKGKTSSAQPRTSSLYPTTLVVTSSGPRTTPSESQIPKFTTASSPPASPTTPTYLRPAPVVTPTTKSEGNICKGVQNNKLLPHQSDCTRYYQCVHSRPFLRTCAQGTIFDIRRQTCNWPALANRPECI